MNTHIHVRTGQVVKEDKTLTLVTRFLPHYELHIKDRSTKKKTLEFSKPGHKVVIQQIIMVAMARHYTHITHIRKAVI